MVTCEYMLARHKIIINGFRRDGLLDTSHALLFVCHNMYGSYTVFIVVKRNHFPHFSYDLVHTYFFDL